MSAQAAKNVKQAVQHQFGEAAAHYAVSATHVGGPDLDAMITASGLEGTSGAARLLDIGTGAGHTAFAFAPLVDQVEALDLTEEMLAQVERGASERDLSNIHCQRGDAEALPYPDGTFDIVTSRLCAHHFTDARAFVRETARVLRPAGSLLLVDSFAPENAAQDTFFNAFELLRDPSHVRNYARSEWQALLDDAGFESRLGGDWMLTQDFADWVARKSTSPTAVAQLRFMFKTAPLDVREAFEIVRTSDGIASVGIPSGLIEARLVRANQR
jgi:ubiquinone/menaquinone biosynthesis C-methylase UbiE